jgi:hypothetical protein
MKRIIIATIVLASINAYASEIDIAIEGNSKTAGIYIRALLKKCLKQMASEEPDAAEEKYLSQCVYNARHFSKVEVKKDVAKYHVNVEEKWSLIPIPVVTAGSGGDEKYGLFGLGKIFAVGGTVGNTGNTYFFHYNDKKVFLSDWNFTASHSRSNQKYSLYDGDEKIFGINENRSNAVLGVGYTFKRFVPAVNYMMQINEYEQLDGFVQPEDYRASKLGFRLRYDYSDYKLYFNKGVTIDANLTRDVSRNDEEKFSTVATGSVKIGVPSFKDQALLGQIQGGNVSGGTETDTFRLGLSKGFRGIPAQGAWPEKYYALSFDYQIPIRKLSFGTWTTAPFTDTGQLKYRSNTGLDAVDYNSIGIGTYIFLKEVAIPGLGLEIGRNNKFQSNFVSFSLGLGM